jgi:serine/threonine-protein kinase PpkA
MGRTRHGELFGTPYYISPEQIDGHPATAQTDIYALGVIFYEMLLRKRPFDADSVPELLALHRTAPRPQLPESLAGYQDLLDRMLAVDPRQRYQNAEEVLEGIDQAWTKQALQALKSHN